MSGKYDTYKGSTLIHSLSVKRIFVQGNMILIKDRHNLRLSDAIASITGNMILIKDRHSNFELSAQFSCEYGEI